MQNRSGEREVLFVENDSQILNIDNSSGEEDVEDLWHPTHLEEYFKEYGYPRETFIRDCWFAGAHLCINNFTEIFDSINGKCFLLRVSCYPKFSLVFPSP